jgi:hypothetical protein
LVILIAAAVPLVLSYAGYRLYLWRAKKPAEEHKKARIATRIAGLLGLAVLASVAAALVVSRDTPFEAAVLDPDTVHKDVEIVVKRDVSGLWIHIAGTFTDLSLELDWRPSDAGPGNPGRQRSSTRQGDRAGFLFESLV